MCSCEAAVNITLTRSVYWSEQYCAADEKILFRSLLINSALSHSLSLSSFPFLFTLPSLFCLSSSNLPSLIVGLPAKVFPVFPVSSRPPQADGSRRVGVQYSTLWCCFAVCCVVYLVSSPSRPVVQRYIVWLRSGCNENSNFNVFKEDDLPCLFKTWT